ncbi:PIG-L deacetylase family protein [Winogradskyella costae]|uniref:PIG-L deacetylase family protein n=1 Tax=Winogradskyella costae TaxID=2697008 RepID=UPI0015CED293|nr:PIG-L family deacetylase [Winogradskyella costae]
MNKTNLIIAILIIYSLFSCNEKVSTEDLKRFVPTENYPADVFLDTVSNKRAVIIVAHDDDDCAMSGTIAKLKVNGWKIKQLSLQSHIIEKTGKNPADIICEGNERLLKNGLYRIGLDTIKNPYLPIPYRDISAQFLTKKVATAIINKVNEFKPSVIFTLDNVKGGYGHPDHIFISQLVKDLFENGALEIKKIYQSVYTDQMEREIIDNWLGAKMKKWGYPSPSDIANKMYGIDGMPEPTVQINIAEVAGMKMDYLRAYDEDVRKNLRKFIPYYEIFDAKTYFEIFDKEFFRVLEKSNH